SPGFCLGLSVSVDRVQPVRPTPSRLADGVLLPAHVGNGQRFPSIAADDAAPVFAVRHASCSSHQTNLPPPPASQAEAYGAFAPLLCCSSGNNALTSCHIVDALSA